MYAIERGMKQKWLAVLFAIFTICASFGVGNMTQSNAVASFTNEVLHVPFWITGLCETVLIALVVLGGVKMIANVCSVLIPFMALFYVCGALFVMGFCWDMVLPAIALILKSAFSTEAVGGGLLGTSIMLAMRYGIARGLFSNESGLGSAPIIAANAKTRNPVRQALISSTGTFWDTVLICALTGIIQVASVLKISPDADFSSFKAQELAKLSFSLIPGGIYVLTLALVIFASTTILGWFCYGQQAIYYLGGKKAMNVYRLLFVVMIFFGAVAKLDLVWNFSDIANGLMAIPNIICLFALCGIVVKETDRYLKKGSIDDFAED